MGEDISYIYNILSQKNSKVNAMGEEGFVDKLNNDKVFYDKVYSWLNDNSLDVSPLLGLKKKAEPTPSPSSGGKLESSETTPIGEPKKTEVKPQIPSILPPSYLKGGQTTSDATTFVRPETPKLDGSATNLKPNDMFVGQNKPTSKEYQQISNNLLQSQRKQQFMQQAQQNGIEPKAAEFEFMRTQADEQTRDAQRKRQVDVYGYKPDGKPKEDFFNLKIEGSSVKIGNTPNNVSSDEQLAAALYSNPLSSTTFKNNFGKNKEGLIDMLKYMPEDRKREINYRLQIGKYDEDQQANDFLGYLNQKSKLSSDDLIILKNRLKNQATQVQQGVIPIEQFEKTKSDFNDALADYDNESKKYAGVLDNFPELAKRNLKETVREIGFESLSKTDPLAAMGMSITDGVVGGIKGLLFELPASINRLLVNYGSEALNQATFGLTPELSKDFKNFTNYTLNDLSSKVDRLARVTPYEKGDVYKFGEELSKVIAEMYLVYGKGAGFLSKVMSNDKAGLFATALLHSYNSQVKQGMEEYGLNSDEAGILGLMTSIPQAALEGIFPDAKAFDYFNKELRTALITRVIRGKEPFREVLEDVLKDVATNTGEELAQGLASNAAQNAYALASNNPQAMVNLIDTSDVANTIGISALSVLIPSIPKLMQSRNINPTKYAQALFTLSEAKQDEFESDVAKNLENRYITPEQAKELIQNVNATRDAAKKIPKDLTVEQKSEMIPLIIRKSDLEANLAKLEKAAKDNEQSGIDPAILEVENGKIKKTIEDTKKKIADLNTQIKESYERAESQGVGAQPTDANDGRPVGGEERVVPQDNVGGEQGDGVAEEAKPTAESTATEGQAEPVSEPLGSEAPQAEAEKTQQPVSDIDAEIERLKKEKENELSAFDPMKDSTFAKLIRKENSLRSSHAITPGKRLKDELEAAEKATIQRGEELGAEINAKYDKQIAELEAKKKTEQTQKQNEQTETTKENVKPVSEGVQGVRTETEERKTSAELRAEEEENVAPAGNVAATPKPKVNPFKKAFESRTKQGKPSETEQKTTENKNAIQESETEGVLPRQQGEVRKTGSERQGVGQSKQGQETAQEGKSQKEIIPNGSQIKVKSSTTGAITTVTYANGKWTFVDSKGKTNAETPKMNDALTQSFMSGDLDRVRTNDELKAMSAVNNIKQSLNSAGIEVKVIDNQAEFDKEAKKQKRAANQNIEGMFLSDDGVIYLNREKLSGEWGETIVFHEGIHPIVNILRNTNPKLLDRIMRGAEQFAKDNTNRNVASLFKFAEQYRMNIEKNNDGKYDVMDNDEVVATFDTEAEAKDFVDTKIKDEFITETFARITSGDIKLNELPSGFKQTLIELVNKILKALRMDINISALNEAEFNKYARLISNTLNEGRDIGEIVGAKNVGEYENNLINSDGTKLSQFSISNKFKNLISDVRYEYISDTEEFLNLIKNKKITNDKKLEDFDDMYVMLHIPDNAFTGKIYKDGELLVDGKGGVYFPIRYNKEGLFWASTEAAVDKLVDILNKTRKANKDGKIRLALISSEADKIMSSSNASNSMIDILFNKAFDKRASLTEAQVKKSISEGYEVTQQDLIDSHNISIDKLKQEIPKIQDAEEKEKKEKELKELIIKGYEKVPKINAKDSESDIRKILTDFYSPDNSSFQVRKLINQNILKSLADIVNNKDASDYKAKLKKEYEKQLEEAKSKGNQKEIDKINKKISQLPSLKKIEERNTAEEILKFLGVGKESIRLKSTGGRLSSSNLMQGFSDLLGEPLLKGGESGNIYAILEIDTEVEKIKIPKEIEHGSYPYSVKGKNGAEIVLHILQDRNKWQKNVLDPKTNAPIGEKEIIDEKTKEPVKYSKRVMEILPTTAGITFSPIKISTKASTAQFSKGSRGRKVYDETGFISVPNMIKIVESNNPDYLGDVMEHIMEMGEKLKNGGVNVSDLSKAYMMAVSSIRSGDINAETFENAIGQKVDEVFKEPNNKIRTEGAMAYLLTTDRGANFIKNIQLGKITDEDKRFISNSMKPFGMFGEGQSKYESLFGKTSEDQINLTNINQFKDLLKNGVKNTDELFDKIRRLKQISQGKVGFVSNFLGIGTRGVIDAREIQGWLRGSVFKGERTDAESEIEKQLNKSNKDLTTLQREILNRMREVGRALGIDENLAEYIGHHMIWDAVANERTTHDGLYLAMKQNQQEFDSRLRELSERNKQPAQFSSAERGEKEVAEINWEESEEGKGDPTISARYPIVQKAAQDLKNGEITNEEYRATVSENSPIRPITRFFAPATLKQIKNAFAAATKKESEAENINKPVTEGEKVGLRLDIPSYKYNNTWVVTVHKGHTKSGPVISYTNVAKIKNVSFEPVPNAALNIATGEKSKVSVARMYGEWVNIDGNTLEEKGENAKKLVQEIVNDPNYVQVGMNPFRHSYFYDRSNDIGRPIKSAEEVIQIGGLVYAKNPVYGNWTDEAYTVKGLFDKAGKPVQFSSAERGAKEIEEDIETEVSEEERDSILQAVELYDSIKDPNKNAKQRKELKAELDNLLDENEDLKRIFANIKDINKQLQDKEIITKEGECP